MAETPRPRAEDLVAALNAVEDVPALISLASFRDDRYVRVLLHQTPDFEVRLLCWRPGQSSALHGHGVSECALRVLSGEATEHRLGEGLRRLTAGQTTSTRPTTVHQVENLGTTPMISLHVYAPPLPVDQPSQADGRRVVIVGGGWCGAALAWHLLDHGGADMRVTLVEKQPSLGRGVAYGTADGAHLLNVPASKMSLDPASPDDFLSFARSRLGEVSPRALLPRPLVGDYMLDRLASAVERAGAKLRLARAEVTDLSHTGTQWRVALSDGRALAADHVILATGHGPLRVPEGLEGLARDRRFIADPWVPGVLGAVPTEARVLLVGTGLTAMDVLGTLRRNRLAGPVIATSRGGRWPGAHLTTVGWTGDRYDLDIDKAGHSADAQASWLKAHISRAWSRGVPWQAVVGALRPHISTLWRRLPLDERARFLQEYRAIWETVRHRAPAESAAALARWHAEGWLRTAPRGVRKAEASSDGLHVHLGDAAEAVVVDRIILCTGAESDVRLREDPLWRSLIAAALVRPDPLGLGILTGERGEVSGAPAGLWAIGGLQRPRLYESTSVPELAVQAAEIAREILGAPRVMAVE